MTEPVVPAREPANRSHRRRALAALLAAPLSVAAARAAAEDAGPSATARALADKARLLVDTLALEQIAGRYWFLRSQALIEAAGAALAAEGAGIGAGSERIDALLSVRWALRDKAQPSCRMRRSIPPPSHCADCRPTRSLT